MSIARSLARPMLASMFVYGGLDSLRRPHTKVATAEKVARPLADALPIGLPDDTEQLVRLNGAVQVGAGLLLGAGILPRLSALALLGSAVPTTAAGHPFWEADGDRRHVQTIQFLKNLSMAGGLLLAVVDTGGRPSVPWVTWSRRWGRARPTVPGRAWRAGRRSRRPPRPRR